MKCPRCGGKSRALETRKAPNGIRRRRQCNSIAEGCGINFSTVEVYAERASAKGKPRGGKPLVPGNAFDVVYYEEIEAIDPKVLKQFTVLDRAKLEEIAEGLAHGRDTLVARTLGGDVP